MGPDMAILRLIAGVFDWMVSNPLDAGLTVLVLVAVLLMLGDVLADRAP